MFIVLLLVIRSKHYRLTKTPESKTTKATTSELNALVAAMDIWCGD
jgi:hypothetical protein